MQYNVSSPQTRFNIFLHYFLQRFTANVFQFGGLSYTYQLLDGKQKQKRRGRMDLGKHNDPKGKKRQNCAYRRR